MTPSLEYFIYIARHRNITRAAEELHITQQCLSNYLKKLEDYYGLPLLTRKPQMNLTPFGETVYKRALMIQGIQNEIEASIPYHQNANPIGIGFSVMHIYQARQLLDIQQFINSNPEAAISIKHASLNSLANMLRSGELDIYFTSFTHATNYPISDLKPAYDFVTKEVCDFNYKVIVTPELVYSTFKDKAEDLILKWQEEGVTISEISSMPLVLLNQLQKLFFLDAREKGYKLRLSAECDNVHLTMELARNSLGFAAVPNFSPMDTLRDGLFQFRIKDPKSLSSSTVYCCSTDTALQRPVVKSLWDMTGKKIPQ